MCQKLLPPCVLEVEAREGQLYNRCQRVSGEGEGVSDAANKTFFKACTGIHLSLIYDLVRTTGKRKYQNKQKCAHNRSIKMEKLVKCFKTHCCALDFDHSFCKATFIDLTNKE